MKNHAPRGRTTLRVAREKYSRKTSATNVRFWTDMLRTSFPARGLYKRCPHHGSSDRAASILSVLMRFPPGRSRQGSVPQGQVRHRKRTYYWLAVPEAARGGACPLAGGGLSLAG